MHFDFRTGQDCVHPGKDSVSLLRAPVLPYEYNGRNSAVQKRRQNMELGEFLESSPVAEKIRLEGRVIVHRAKLSQADILDIRRTGSMEPIDRQDQVCELVVAGQKVATGRIVKKSGEWFFQVTGMNAKEE
jgi:hypothetical protein